MYTIRHAEKSDKSRILDIYASARRRMAEGGNPDPTYAYIEGPGWLNERPYLTIHRIARADGFSGIFTAVMDFCAGYGKDIRIDTHEKNKPMLHLVRSNGFKECGVIYLQNGSPRIAFQKEHI